MLKIRQNILGKTEISTILELKGDVFDDAVIGGNIVIVLEKNNNQDARNNNIVNAASIGTLDLENVSFNKISQYKYLQSFQNRFYVNTNETAELFSKIMSNKLMLGEVCDIKNGVNTGNAAKILLSETKKYKKSRPILEGKDVNRFSINWGGLWINYDLELKQKIDINELETRQGKIDFALRDETIFNSEKIIIRQTADEFNCIT